MSAQNTVAYSRECGLRVLRDVVTKDLAPEQPRKRRMNHARACPLHVVSVDLSDDPNVLMFSR